MRAMQPVPDESLSCDAFALRDLCFVVRENIIDTAAMNVDLIAEQRRRHCTTFNVPAGTTRSPRRIPFHVAIFFVPRLTQCEVADVFLVVLVVLNSARRLQLGKVEMRELSVIRKFVDAKIN